MAKVKAERTNAGPTRQAHTQAAEPARAGRWAAPHIEAAAPALAARALARRVGDQRARRILAASCADGTTGGADGPKLAVTSPGDAREREADRVAGVAHVRGATGSPALQRKADPLPDTLPWIGTIHSTWSAALRKTPGKDLDAPHANTVADLARGTEVEVVGQSGGWLHVHVRRKGRTLDGYVSAELVSYVRASAIQLDEVVVEVKIPSVADALVVLKQAQRRKAAEGSGFRLSDEERDRLNLAIAAIKRSGRYAVDPETFEVTRIRREGVRTTIETIEDFILFVEDVERQYPGATPAQVVSEVRQAWFSDVNWELLVASEGISEGGKQVDIETRPNPIANRYDMAKLAPEKGGFRLRTPMGMVEISHVMAGIDARLSGFPGRYRGGHDDSERIIKYRTLKKQTGGDSRDFATWAGDLGQAYAEYLVHRYVADHHGAHMAGFAKTKAAPRASWLTSTATSPWTWPPGPAPRPMAPSRCPTSCASCTWSRSRPPGLSTQSTSPR
jgi:hypothetical protein